MWQWHSETLSDAKTIRYSLSDNQQSVSFAQVIDAWQHDPEFRIAFNTLLAESEFVAFRWETPGISTDTVERPFEFVLLNAPALDRHVDSSPFASHFRDDQAVVAFRNLGGDALLIVPCPQTTDDAYGHLAAFVRSAPASQQDSFWQLVGEQMSENLDTSPIWLSTAGMGVAWLHVRLDARPKYYGHLPYRSIQ